MHCEFPVCFSLSVWQKNFNGKIPRTRYTAFQVCLPNFYITCKEYWCKVYVEITFFDNIFFKMFEMDLCSAKVKIMQYFEGLCGPVC